MPETNSKPRSLSDFLIQNALEGGPEVRVIQMGDAPNDPVRHYDVTAAGMIARPDLDAPRTASIDSDAMPEAALEALKSITRDRPRGGNPHQPMLSSRYVSGSQTVKKTCVELAALITGATPDDSDPHWGEGGNALADINLAYVPYGENEASVPIPGAVAEGEPHWRFIIHADGLVLQDKTGAIMTPDEAPSIRHMPGRTYISEAFVERHPEGPYWLSAEEHKAPVFPYNNEDSWDIARRQARTFMGAVMEMIRIGDRVLQPAPYLKAGDPKKIPMPLPKNVLPGAVNLICAPYSAEREERLEPVTAKECSDELDRCLTKAKHAILTATGEDPGAAARWDAEHPEEFLWRLTEKVPANRDEATKEINRLLLAHRLLQPTPDTGKAAREKARDRIKVLVKKHGLPQELDFTSGVGYRLTATNAFSSVGALPMELRAEAEAVAAHLASKGLAVE